MKLSKEHQQDQLGIAEKEALEWSNQSSDPLTLWQPAWNLSTALKTSNWSEMKQLCDVELAKMDAGNYYIYVTYSRLA